MAHLLLLSRLEAALKIQYLSLLNRLYPILDISLSVHVDSDQNQISHISHLPGPNPMRLYRGSENVDRWCCYFVINCDDYRFARAVCEAYS